MEQQLVTCHPNSMLRMDGKRQQVDLVESIGLFEAYRRFGYFDTFDIRKPKFGANGVFSSRIDSSIAKITSPALQKCAAQLGVDSELLRLLLLSMSLLKELVIRVGFDSWPPERSHVRDHFYGAVGDAICEVDDLLVVLDYMTDAQVDGGGTRSWEATARTAFARLAEACGRVDVLSRRLKSSLGLAIFGGSNGLFLSRIDSSVAKITSAALQKCGAQLGVGDQLLRLQSSMSLLKARVAEVDSKPPPPLMRWSSFRELEGVVRDAIYDVGDLLDELEDQHYKMMAQRVKKWSNWKESLRNAFVNRAWDAATGIIDVCGKVDIVNCQLKAFLGLINVSSEEERHLRVEMPPALERPLVGREKERERLMLWLTDVDGHDEGDKLSILPIVGMGGLGKTALVRSVVHEPQVLDCFRLRMWVSVSQNFNVKELTRQMLFAVTGEEYPDTANLDRLQTVLRDELSSKRFLLVLDDVWNEDRSKWETFCAPFMSGLPGSKILVTARSRRVSYAMGVLEPMFLPVLSDESFWMVFKMCAFGSEDSDKFPGLELIGKKIADKLKGLPLAAVTVGKHLNLKLEEKQWEIILERDVWKLEQRPNDLLPVLELSYAYLPAHLKSCFSFCGLFPNDYVFDKLSLVQMWMAHDFIIPQGNSLIEDVGHEYFDDLLHKSFFQKCHDGYIMHPLLGDMARYISKDEYFTVRDGMSEAMIPATVRHISVQAPNIELDHFIDMCKNKKLRTLLFFGEFGGNVCRALDGLENERTSIRVLDFGCCDIKKLPDSIGKLKQLRYFDARGTRVQTLPRSFASLWKLQVLKVLNESFKHLPREVTKLINLRYLDVVSYYISQIDKTGRLTSYHELGQYGYAIEELKNMNEYLHSKNPAVLSGPDEKWYIVHVKMGLKWASKKNAFRGSDENDANARRASFYDGKHVLLST